MTDDFEDRKRLTFEQAEGAEPLPSQLKLKEVSQQLRALLWSGVYSSLTDSKQRPYQGPDYVGPPWEIIFLDMHTLRQHSCRRVRC